MKKILILLFPLFLIPSFNNVFASETISTPVPHDYKSGLFDIDDIIKDTNVHHGSVDNKIDSLDPIKSIYVDFEYPVNLTGYYLNGVTSDRFANYSISFLDGTTIQELTEVREGYVNIDYKNVIRFELNHITESHALSLYQFDLFGNFNPNDSIPTIPEPTEEDLEEVGNVVIETEPDRVNLSWKLPETEYFHHVKIYRKDLGKNEQEISFFEFLKPMKVHASTDDFNPIFETNGTYFNDLTVEENSKYEYKLTTEYQGLESQGVIVQATTPISPAPPLEGGGGEQQANGDYLFKWASPREGQVRVFVDGTEYATVEASTGQLLVPGSAMKYSALGRPLISYQTIGLNGEESNITSPDISDLEIPVTPGEVIETGSQLIGIVSSFILLGLSFIFAPKLIKFIRQSFSNKKEDSGRGREREQRESRTSIRETRQPRQGRTRTRTPRTYREGRA